MPLVKQLARIAILASFGSAIAIAQPCESSMLSTSLVVSAPGGTGTGCVGNYPGQARICAPDGKLIVRSELKNIQNANAMILQNNITTDKDGCAVASVVIRPNDHRGSYPLYFCSPARFSAALEIYICDKH
jgi:hypothetical protein